VTHLRRTIDYRIVSESRTEVMGIMMLAVFLIHARIFWPEHWLVMPFKFLARDSAYVVVDVLLFCSAYGLVRSRFCNPMPWARFLYRRLIRILPAYLLVMAALSAYEILAGPMPSLSRLFFRFSTLGFWFGRQGPLASEWFIPALMGLYLLFPALFTWYGRARNKTAFVVWGVVISLLIGLVPILINRPNLLMFTTRIPAFILGIDIGYKVFGNSSGPRSTSTLRAILITVACYVAVAVLFLVTTDPQRGRYGLYWPLFIPAIVPLGLLFAQLVAALRTDRWRKVTRPILWLLAFCGTYALEIMVLHEPLYYLARGVNYLNTHVPGLHRVLGIINWGRYLEFALYAVLALALAPLLHRITEAIRKPIDAIVEGGQPGTGMRARVMLFALAILVTGAMAGVFFQKYYGLGRVLRAVGVQPRANQIATPSINTPGPLAPLADIPQEFQGKMALFLLAGQSNMAGKGDLPPPSASVHDRVFIFGNDYRWHVATEPVDHPGSQVDPVSQDHWAGAGPALPFALEITKRDPSLVIGLIPCAMEETTISQWARNLSDRSLYGSCLKRAQAAATMGEVAGLFFFQGEADAIDPKAFPHLTPIPMRWADRFSVMVSDFRRDLALPQLPVVFAQIGTTTLSTHIVPHWDTVKQQQRSVELADTAMIATDDLPLQDEVHFTTASYQEIGRRFADAYWSLTRRNE
jgi:peptidoglycan/LPS O-acetylase OafA/YrhL